jgi:hypothetical protein
LYRSEGGLLQKDLESSGDEQIEIIAEIIQRIRPDVLALQEFDFDEEAKTCNCFRKITSTNRLMVLSPSIILMPWLFAPIQESRQAWI